MVGYLKTSLLKKIRDTTVIGQNNGNTRILVSSFWNSYQNIKRFFIFIFFHLLLIFLVSFY